MKKISFRNQLIFSIVGLLATTVIILSSVLYLEANRRIVDTMTAQAVQVVDALYRQVSLFTSQTMTEVKLQADAHAFKTLLRERRPDTVNIANSILKDFISLDSSLETAILIDSKGNVVSSSDPTAVGKINMSDRSYFADAMAGKTVISDVVISKTTNDLVLVMAAPVRSGEGTIGLLAVSISLANFTKQYVDPIKLGTEGYAYVMNDKCMTIMHPNRNHVLKTNLCGYDFGREMAQKKNGLINYEFEGIKKLVAFRTEESTRWTIGISATHKDLYAASISMRNVAIVLGLIFGAIGFGIAKWIAHSVLGTLGKDPDEISRVIEMIASGDLDMSFDDKINFGVYSRVREMVKNLRSKEDLAKAIAANDLTKQVELASERDRLGIALRAMVTNLKEMVIAILNAAKQIEVGTRQVSAASQALSQGATEQAASMEEITSSMTEISSQAKQNAENAAQARQLATESREAAEKGRSDIQGTLNAMTEISQSSKMIDKIIKVIDDIAFQTNLLALNAAVEAARAGKHGKGFAVVAEEVRGLASRSAKAARETADLIGTSTRSVDAGLAVVKNTAQSFEEILKNTIKVADIVGEIASASHEQANGSAQVSTGLGQLDHVTQANTSSAEETASAAEEMAGQAEAMRTMLARFKLDTSDLAQQKIDRTYSTETPVTTVSP